MKKSLTITIIMIFIIGIFGGIVNAASAGINANQKTVEVGNNVSVTISFSQKVSKAQFNINYDSNMLKYVSHSCNGNGLYEYGKETSKFAYASSNENMNTVTFVFTALKVGTTKVSINGLRGTATSVSSGTTTINIKEKSKDSGQTVNPEEEISQGGNSTSQNSQTSSAGTSSSANASSLSTNKGTNPNNTLNNNIENEEENNNEEQNEQEQQQEQINAQEEIKSAPKQILDINQNNLKTLKDDKTNVMIKGLPIALEDDTVLEVEAIQDDDEKIQLLNDILKDIKGIKNYFNIRLLKDNMVIQPNGYVTVFIPIPEGANKENLVLYSINENTRNYELIEGKIQGEYYTFTTNNISNYALVEKVQDKTFIETIFDNILYIILAAIVIIVIITIIVVITKNKGSH